MCSRSHHTGSDRRSSHSAHDSGAFEKFKASSWGKKLARQSAKAAQNDFDRFKATLAKVRHRGSTGM